MADSFADELRAKWPVVVVAFLMMFLGFGVPTFALPFVYSGAVKEFAWANHEAVLLSSFKFYTSAVASLIVGRLLDKADPKYVVAFCAALGGIAMLGFLEATTLPVYYFIGVILGLNAAGMAVSMNAIVARTFRNTMGVALGIVLSGTSMAGLVVPPIVAALMESVGWRPAMAIISVAIWVAALPAWFVLFATRKDLTDKMRNTEIAAAKTGMWDHFKGLARTRNFWFIVAGIFLVSAVDQGVTQNQVLFLEQERGLSLASVAWASSLFALIGIGAKIGFGWVYDRLSILGIVLCYGLLAVATGLSFTVVGMATMFFFMATRGIAHGGLIVDGPVLAKHYYGPENLGLNIGIFTLCTSLGYGFGPPLMASMADESGTYLGGFAIAAVAALLAAVLLYPVKPRYWSRGEMREASGDVPGAKAGIPS